MHASFCLVGSVYWSDESKYDIKKKLNLAIYWVNVGAPVKYN